MTYAPDTDAQVNRVVAARNKAMTAIVELSNALLDCTCGDHEMRFHLGCAIAYGGPVADHDGDGCPYPGELISQADGDWFLTHAADIRAQIAEIHFNACDPPLGNDDQAA
jgi:hypothetical protein